MNSVRTFIAVDVPPEIVARADEARRRLEAGAAGVRWVEPELMHLTIKFLGEISLRDVAEVCRCVERATADVTPFDLEFVGLGGFPSTERPRTLWVGVGAGGAELTALHARVETELDRVGYRRERRFAPHLTLGRARSESSDLPGLGRQLAALADVEIGVTYVDELVVYSSELTRTGPRYEPLGHLPLRGRNR
jgi:RNA 2',3'-cyclic 3'-phosphodiesterase